MTGKEKGREKEVRPSRGNETQTADTHEKKKKKKKKRNSEKKEAKKENKNSSLGFPTKRKKDTHSHKSIMFLMPYDSGSAKVTSRDDTRPAGLGPEAVYLLPCEGTKRREQLSKKESERRRKRKARP